MPKLNPSHIFNEFMRAKIDRKTAISYLRTIIENEDDNEFRTEALKTVYRIEGSYRDLFLFLENLVVSDSSEQIRAIASIIIIQEFLEEGLKVLKWVIEHDESMMCLVAAYSTLNSINSNKSDELINFLDKTLQQRFSDLDYYEREDIGLGFLERLMGKVQYYLLDKAYYSELNLVALIEEFEILLRDPDFKHSKKEYIVVLKNFIEVFNEPVPNEDGQKEKELELLIRTTKLGLEIEPNNQVFLHNLNYAHEELINTKEE